MDGHGTVRRGAMILSFRLGSVPVRVHLWFPLMGMLLGFGAHDGLPGAAARGIGFLLTVFAHELAHTIAARWFGAPAEVELTLFGGTLGARIASLSRARRVVVCLVGPAVSLLTGAMVFGMARMRPPASEIGVDALRYLGWINLAWGLLNLLPIFPLDAAHALVAALDGATKGRGEPAVRCLSIGLAMVFGCSALTLRMIPAAFVCGLVVLQNGQGLRMARDQRNREAIRRVHLQAAFAALERSETAMAISHCRAILGASPEPPIRRDAVRLLAYAYATTSDWAKLLDLLESGGVRALDPDELEKYQQAARELGRPEDAQRIAFLRRRFA
jgi:stage IV sporulation protein FB